MPIRNPNDLIQALLDRPVIHRRLLGLDLGEKTIGMAISDPMWSVASPIDTIRRTKFTTDARSLANVMLERSVGGLVLGLPLNMDGSEGPRVQSTRDFARNLFDRTDLFQSEPEITFWDERLSTQAVERQMIAWDVTRKKRAKMVDKSAAAYILQGFLDAMARSSNDM